jgi:hypothetical protein
MSLLCFSELNRAQKCHEDGYKNGDTSISGMNTWPGLKAVTRKQANKTDTSKSGSCLGVATTNRYLGSKVQLLTSVRSSLQLCNAVSRGPPRYTLMRRRIVWLSET